MVRLWGRLGGLLLLTSLVAVSLLLLVLNENVRIKQPPPFYNVRSELFFKQPPPVYIMLEVNYSLNICI